MESNGFVPVSLFILGLALIGVMTLGVLGWKLLRFLQSLLTPSAASEPEERPVRRAKPVKPPEDDSPDLSEESAQTVTDRMVRKNWK